MVSSRQPEVVAMSVEVPAGAGQQPEFPQMAEEEDVVELDEERKAAMVSNLLGVLCSEQATHQVVNTGSLYQ
jgi:hypothetical protein